MKNNLKQHEKNNTIGSCFTLIELLVVIAMIAILAGMLHPALNKARDRARGASCLSNQKQVLLGIMTYADDHNSLLVVRNLMSADTKYKEDYGWAEFLTDFGYIPEDFKLLSCPVIAIPLKRIDDAKKYKKITYGMINWDATPNYTYKHWYDNQIYLNLKRLTKPSMSMFGGDSYQYSDHWGGDMQYYLYSPGSDGTNVHARHSKRMNMMYLDGHATATAPQDYKNNLLDGDAGYTGDVKYFDENKVNKAL
ncbi:MAG: type II secretion system protein [Lentisphaeria bacterium]|nr:type II secretion system protein [Lentisphaeria bacterium]